MEFEQYKTDRELITKEVHNKAANTQKLEYPPLVQLYHFKGRITPYWDGESWLASGGFCRNSSSAS